jgi:hypothetical protein
MREHIPFKLPFLCLNFSPANKKRRGCGIIIIATEILARDV